MNPMGHPYKLLICTVLEPSDWCLYDSDFRVIHTQKLSISGKEFDQFLPSLHRFLQEAGTSIKEVDTVYSVTGPAPFTGGRIVSLTLGSLAKVHPLQLAWLTLFEFWQSMGNPFPMAVEANDTELAIQKMPDSDIELVSKTENIEYATWYARRSNLSNRENLVQYALDFPKAVETLKKLKKNKTLDPLYVKKPNITLSNSAHVPDRTQGK